MGHVQQNPLRQHEQRSVRAAPIAGGDGLLASIIVPMRNESRHIEQCLDSILANALPQQHYEILVVDGDSQDSCRDLVLEKAKTAPNIRLLRNNRHIVPVGLNLAIQQARGRYIIRMDAHAEYPPNYVENCISELERTQAANVGGRCLTRPGADSDIARAIALATQSPVCVGNSAYRIGAGDRYVDTVPFGAFRATLFRDIGLFREDLVRHQDFELNARIRRAGGRIYLSPKLYSIYYNVPTFARFMQQAYSNGLWEARSWIRYPVSFCWRHAAPLTFVSVIGTLSLLSISHPLARLSLAALLTLYFATLTVGAWRVSRGSRARLFCLIPLITVCYHVVYGLASLPGLITGPRWTAVASSGRMSAPHASD